MQLINYLYSVDCEVIESEYLIFVIVGLYCSGVVINWNMLFIGGVFVCVDLLIYFYQCQSYWVDKICYGNYSKVFGMFFGCLLYVIDWFEIVLVGDSLGEGDG